MAMRLYTREEFEAELREKWGLKPTDHATKTTRAWITPNGDHLLVPVFPDGDRYPDHLLDKIVQQIETFGKGRAR